MAERVKVAVLGTGNIGTDLLLKLLRLQPLEVAVFAGVDPASAGIARARSLGVPTSSDGIDAVLADDDVRVVFDASSAGAHRRCRAHPATSCATPASAIRSPTRAAAEVMMSRLPA